MCPPPPALITPRGQAVRWGGRSFAAPVQECSPREQVGCWIRWTLLPSSWKLSLKLCSPNLFLLLSGSAVKRWEWLSSSPPPTLLVSFAIHTWRLVAPPLNLNVTWVSCALPGTRHLSDRGGFCIPESLDVRSWFHEAEPFSSNHFWMNAT